MDSAARPEGSPRLARPGISVSCEEPQPLDGRYDDEDWPDLAGAPCRRSAADADGGETGTTLWSDRNYPYAFDRRPCAPGFHIYDVTSLNRRGRTCRW